MRAIHGAEVDLDDGRHLTLLVETQEGWRNLCRIITRAHAHTRDPREPPPTVPLETIEEHAAGLVCLSGCARHGVHDEPTLRAAAATRSGREGLRVELQRPFQRDDRARNRRLAGLAARLGRARRSRPATSTRTRARGRRCRTRSSRCATTRRSTRPSRCGAATRRTCWPRRRRWRPASRTIPRRCASAIELAERLRFDLTVDLGYRYPGSEDPVADRTLAEICCDRIDERYPPGSPHRDAAHARLDEELRVIAQLGWPASSSCTATCSSSRARWRSRCAARTRRARCCRRGAAAAPRCPRSSATSPASRTSTRWRNELFLGRFLNEELTALPDIDLDFPRDIREVLIPRVHDRYGRERSALVAAFPTFRSRGAIRELGKVLGLPPGELERVARGAEPFAVRGVTADVEVGARAGAGRAARAAGRSRFADAAVRPVGRRMARDGQRPPARPRRAPAGRRAAAAPRSPAAGRGWPACATRPTACRATSPSTRAG